MRISAEFEQYEDALVAHRALVDEIKVDPENLEIRSPYPLPEDAIPPHRHRRMRMRNWVRFLWVCGAISGFTLAAGTQLDYPIKTAGHPIVPIPINAIITYECGMITGLVSTCILFFLETRTFRNRPIPQREDLAVANGDCALVVDGPMVEKARERLQGARGVRTVRTYTSFLAVVGLLLLTLSMSGCTVRMRNQPAIRDSERPTVSAAAGVSSMPWWKDPDVEGLPEPYGRLLTPHQFATLRAKYPVMAAQGGRSTPVEVASFANPVPDDPKSLAYGQQLFTENCTSCHGDQGKGDGKMADIYLPKPANLSRQDLVNESDGQLYWTISMAPLGMPPFATRMSGIDRFTLVKHLRKLQKDAGMNPNTGGPTNMAPPAAASPTPSPTIKLPDMDPSPAPASPSASPAPATSPVPAPPTVPSGSPAMAPSVTATSAAAPPAPASPASASTTPAPPATGSPAKVPAPPGGSPTGATAP